MTSKDIICGGGFVKKSVLGGKSVVLGFGVSHRLAPPGRGGTRWELRGASEEGGGFYSSLGFIRCCLSLRGTSGGPSDDSNPRGAVEASPLRCAFGFAGRGCCSVPPRPLTVYKENLNFFVHGAGGS